MKCKWHGTQTGHLECPECAREAVTSETAEGMFASDRCKFCLDYYEKAKPWICPSCWGMIKNVVGEYPEEFGEIIAKAQEVQPEIAAKLRDVETMLSQLAKDAHRAGDEQTVWFCRARKAEMENYAEELEELSRCASHDCP